MRTNIILILECPTEKRALYFADELSNVIADWRENDINMDGVTVDLKTERERYGKRKKATKS